LLKSFSDRGKFTENDVKNISVLGRGNPDKKELVLAFFREFRKKVARLREINSNSYTDEAFTLCVVYIDRLASGYYGGEAGKNQENFCLALRELSGDPLFAMLHPQELLQRAQQYFPGAVPLLNSIVALQPDSLMDETAVAAKINRSTIEPSKRKELIENLWRASIAAICYAHIRGPEIHGPGSGGLDFDRSAYGDKKGIKIDFDRVHEALLRILDHVEEVSVKSGHWFGNPDYLKARP
jgi:hypothetical protein